MNVGVIGSGAISDIYLKNMIEKYPNLTVKAVASKHIENARKKAEKYGIQACTVEELLGNPEIGMAVVLTPVGTHYELIRQALLAGKHVYTEKTISDSVEKARELLTLANERGLMLGSAPDTFLGAAWQKARELLDGGAIGEVQSFALSANRCNDILLNWFRFLREPGCGLLYDYGVYYLTCLCNLLGAVNRVIGICRNPYPNRRNPVPDAPDYGAEFVFPNESQVSAILELESGVTGTLHMNAESLMSDQAFFAIYGTKGILYLTDPNGFGGTVRIAVNNEKITLPPGPEKVTTYETSDENLRGIGPSDLAEAIEKGTGNRASKEMAFHVLEVLNGILKSSEAGGEPVKIASTAERPAPLG